MNQLRKLKRNVKRTKLKKAGVRRVNRVLSRVWREV